MSLLTDTNLSSILSTTDEWDDKICKLHIYPYDSKSMTPIGYDLRVGEEYSSALKAGIFTLKEGEIIEILPKDTVLITTLETIGMPQNKSLSGFIFSKVSKVSMGLSHISTTVDPDWNGPLLIAIHNHSTDKVRLKNGEQFCTIVFIENKSCATKDCKKPSGRKDVLIADWKKSVRKAEKKNLIKGSIPPAIIFVALILGYYIFGNTSGFIATVGGAVGLSKLSEIYLKIR